MTLAYRERPAASEPEGLLVLFHGRGADEHDLFPLLDLLDPERRLLGVTPRGPLSLPPGGAHWYAVQEIGYPDPGTFLPTYEATSDWLASLAEETGIGLDRTVLGGFSQGAVMTYALGLGRGRPRPAALVALSGFMPTVPGFELDLEPALPPVAIGHGSLDPVISVEWSRRAKQALEAAGAEVLYREYPLPHAIDPRFPGRARALDRFGALRDRRPVARPAARAEVGQPGHGAQAHPDRRQQHVEDDDGAGQDRPPGCPAPGRDAGLRLHETGACAPVPASARRCSTSRITRAAVSSIERSEISITGHPRRRWSVSASSSSA